MNINQLRSYFPVTEQAVYLNSASQSPLNSFVNNKLQEAINLEGNPMNKKALDRSIVKDLLSKILGGASKSYALQTSTGVGIGIVAQGLQIEKGDNIVIPEQEHWNNTFPWMELAKEGIELRFVKLNVDNSFKAEDFESLVDSKTKLVSVAAVRFNSGFRPNIKAIGEIAHRNGALFMVDAAQGAGMIPINVVDDNIDILVGCGFKWLLGMHGTGYMYVNDKASKLIKPVLPGMFAAKHDFYELNYHNDSRKYETGTIAYTLFDAWSAGLELILQIGVENIYQKALENTDIIIAGLQNKGFNIISPIKNREDRTAIIHFNTGSFETTNELYLKLKSNKVLVTLQGENIRVSPNFFNNKEEIEIFVNMI